LDEFDTEPQTGRIDRDSESTKLFVGQPKTQNIHPKQLSETTLAENGSPLLLRHPFIPGPGTFDFVFGTLSKKVSNDAYFQYSN
jgi:hypothetical protein